MTARIVVLASGTGTLLQSLLSAGAPEDVGFTVAAVVADRPDAIALQRAGAHGVPAVVVAPSDHPDRASWDRALAQAIGEYHPDWIVCAGFMRILGRPVLEAFPHRIVNAHPALLPAFAGAHGVRDALDYGVRVTGSTIHLVDAGVDTGPILAQECVEVRDDDDEATLHERIKIVERRLLLEVVSRLCRDGCTVTGRRVSIP